MKARQLTTEEIRQSSGRDYNPSIWDQNIDGMLKYSDVLFFHVPKGDGFDYDRYFVEYTLPEGLRLFRSFSYSSSITSGGFYRLDRIPVTEDGRSYLEVMNLAKDGDDVSVNKLIDELDNSKFFNVIKKTFTTHDGKECVCDTTPKARQWMIEKSKLGVVFTKGF